MATQASPNSYSSSQITLHWVIAALVTFQILVHDGMEDAFDSVMRAGSPGDSAVWAYVHATIGIIILLLALWRLGLRMTRGAPPLHRDKPALIVWMGGAAHILLYALIILVPLSGAAAWFFSLESAAEAHEIGKTILLIVVGLHVLGALAEHFFFRNDSLTRMLGRPPL